jgi:CubicO group peptidase (beta-lactamase class C family)
MRSSCLLLALLVASCAAPAPPPASAPLPEKRPLRALAEASTVPTDAGAPEAPLSPLPENFGAWVDEYVSAFGRNWGEGYAMSGYVMVARDGKPVFAKAYGKANRTTGAVADGDTRFRIGSITKQFTSVAILQQVEKGTIHLEDHLSKYLPDLPFADRVAIHHLLSHTSGVASYTDDEALMKTRDRPHPAAEVVASFANKPLQFEPGSEFRYSNSNYFLLGLVLEKVTGQTYKDYLDAHVLGPAGMTRTSAADTPDAPDSAVGYTRDGETITPAGAVDMSLPFAAGSIRSTPNDMVRWDRALASDVLLTEPSRRRMVTPVLGGYAYGVGVGTVLGREVDEHGGGIDGFLSGFARVPQEKLAVAIFSNNDSFDPEPILDAIVKMALGGGKVAEPVEKAPLPVDAATMARFAGDYALDPDNAKAIAPKLSSEVIATFATLAMENKDGHLRFKPVGQGSLEVFRASDGSLFTKQAGLVIVAEPAKGQAKRVTVTQDDIQMVFVRVASKPAPAARPKK